MKVAGCTVHVDWRNRKAVWCLHVAARCTGYLYRVLSFAWKSLCSTTHQFHDISGMTNCANHGKPLSGSLLASSSSRPLVLAVLVLVVT
jgi:hypothetical protein